MSYLLDKKIQRKKFFNTVFYILCFSVFIYFRSTVFHAFSYASHAVFHPVLVLGNNIGEELSSVTSMFHSKNALLKDNESMKAELDVEQALVSNYNSVLDENIKMKEILGRKKESVNMVLAAILSKPNQSLYGTLVIDRGASDGLLVGEKVFALGNIPIGRIAEVDKDSSKVILFSNPGEQTEAIVSGKNIFVQLIGRGGGNFEMILVKDLVVEKGMEVALPGINNYLLATVETIISDTRESFQKALLASPVNVQELKFVQVEK